MDVFEQALAGPPSEAVIVFLDEVNTCPYMGLLSEILTEKRLAC